MPSTISLKCRPRCAEIRSERTPFLVSANELRFAMDHAAQFRLYRLFDFRVAHRLFELDGPIDRHCMLDATTYRASFAA